MLDKIRRNRPRRGYSLAELLAVVSMVGILAALAVVSYRKWMSYARVASAKDLVSTITLNQHQYFEDTAGYLDCSADLATLYPTANGPDNRKHHFHDSGTGAVRACWLLLQPNREAATYANFATVAGTAAETPPSPPTQQAFNWPNLVRGIDKPWFLVLAVTDLNMDGTKGYILTSSFQPGTVHVEEEPN